MTASPPSRPERPVVVRGAILVFGLIIVFSTARQWLSVPAEPEKPVRVWFFVIPLVLASSMILQFFAKHRGSPLLAVSIGIICVSLLLLWLFAAGHLG